MDMIKIVEQWHRDDGDGTEEEFNYCSTHLEVVDSSEDVDGKYVTYSTVYKDNNTGKYYEAYTVRTNNGYWSDSEFIDRGCFEVVPQQVVKTVYVAVK